LDELKGGLAEQFFALCVVKTKWLELTEFLFWGLKKRATMQPWQDTLPAVLPKRVTA